VFATLLLIHSVTFPGAVSGVNFATQVGQPFDNAAISKDVKTLWNLGRFHDISVETVDRPEGTDVIFHATAEPRYEVNEIQLKPNHFGVQLAVAPHSLLTRFHARDLAHTAERQLNDRGYWQAKVDWKFAPISNGRYNLVLTVTPGDAPKVRASGDTSQHPPKVYSNAAIENYAARLTSHYIAMGYYDVKINVTHKVVGKDAMVNFDVVRGDFQRPIDTKILCGCLFRQRRAAELRGIVDFSASLDQSGIAQVQLGRPYTVGRINFSGYKHFSDSTIRRNLLIDEGAPLDGQLLRRSLARINRAGIFEDIDERQVQIQDTLRPGVADINIHLIERRHGSWNFSGPLPLSASIKMRLPAWGQRVFEMSTYAVSFNLLAYSSFLKLTTARRFMPILSLERPFMPGAGWLSGFSYSPQIPKKIAAANYLYTQFDRRIQPLLAGQRGPDIPVIFQRPSGGEATLMCEAPKPRFATARMVFGIGLNVIRSFAAF
jgi:Surface antigen variable number repeat